MGITTGYVDRSTRVLGSEIAGLADRINTLETGAKASQLGDSSIENGYLSIYDDSGVVRAIIGKQSDGTYVGGNSLNNPYPPPVPKAPIVTSVLGGLKIIPNGSMTGSWPADFVRYNIYAQDHTVATPVLEGTLSDDHDVFILAPLPAGTTWDVWLTSVNLSGKESIASDIGSGSPNAVVSTDILDGIVTTLKLADDAVTTAKIAAKAVTKTEIGDLAVGTPQLIAGSVQALQIAVDAVSAGKIAADAVTAREIAALTITSAEVATNAIKATNIETGAVTAAKMAADMVLANRIIVGSPTGVRVELHPFAGIQAFNAVGSRTVYIDAASGSFSAIGSISTGVIGARIQMNTGGVEPDRMRFYPTGGGGYGCLDSITSGTGNAGIMMYSSAELTNPTQKGIVVAREDYASLVWGSTDLNSLPTDIFASPGTARMRSGLVELVVEETNTRNGQAVSFWHRTGGTMRTSTLLEYRKTAADGGEPQLACGYRDIGLVFSDNVGSGLNTRMYVVGNNTTQRRDIFVYSMLYEGDVVKTSSRVGKRNIAPAADIDMRQGTRHARAHRFQKEHLDEAPVWYPDGRKKRGGREAPVQLGLIAEDMPEQATTMIDHVTSDGLSLLGINTDVVTTLLWQGLGEVYDKLDELGGTAVIPHTTIPPLPPVTGALLYEHNGSLWVVTSTGQRSQLS